MTDVCAPTPQNQLGERRAWRQYLLCLVECQKCAVSLETLDSFLGDSVKALVVDHPAKQLHLGVKQLLPSLLQELVAEGFLELQ